MFEVEVSRSRNVVLIRFKGELTEADFTALDGLGRERSGTPYDVIFDMTGVEKAELATGFVSRRGDLPQAYPDRARIYVVQQEDLKLLVRLYAAYQESRGFRPPTVSATLDEALKQLQVGADEFEAWPFSP
jgi:hypothetical protein